MKPNLHLKKTNKHKCKYIQLHKNMREQQFAYLSNRQFIQYFIGRLWWCLRTRVLEPIFDIKTTIYTYILTCKHTTHIHTQLNEYIYMRINTYV